MLVVPFYIFRAFPARLKSRRWPACDVSISSGRLLVTSGLLEKKNMPLNGAFPWNYYLPGFEAFFDRLHPLGPLHTESRPKVLEIEAEDLSPRTSYSEPCRSSVNQYLVQFSL